MEKAISSGGAQRAKDAAEASEKETLAAKAKDQTLQSEANILKKRLKRLEKDNEKLNKKIQDMENDHKEMITLNLHSWRLKLLPFQHQHQWLGEHSDPTPCISLSRPSILWLPWGVCMDLAFAS